MDPRLTQKASQAIVSAQHDRAESWRRAQSARRGRRTRRSLRRSG